MKHLLLAAALLAGAATAAPLKLGIALPRTGDLSPVGLEELTAVVVALNYFNATSPTKLEPVYVDVSSDPADAAAQLIRLARQNVIGIVGPTSDDQANAAAKIAEKFGVPLLALATSGKATQAASFAGRISSSPALVLGAAARAALKAAPGKLLISAPGADDAGALALLGVLDKNTAAVLTRANNVEASARQVVAAKPSVVAVTGPLVEAAPFVKALRRAGYNGVLVGGLQFNSPAVFAACGFSCAGMFVGTQYKPDGSNVAASVFAQYYQGQFRTAPSQRAAQAFTAVQAFFTAVGRSEASLGKPLSGLKLDLARQLINATLQGEGQPFDSPLGRVSFNVRGDLIQKSAYATRVKMTDASHGVFTYTGGN